jgi:hypothetical protein
MDLRARIYRPAKNAMQSGKANTREWLLEFEPEKPKSVEPLMGWTSASETLPQVTLEFATRAAAENYAKARALEYELIDPLPPARKSKAYSDNFRYDRKIPWSH